MKTPTTHHRASSLPFTSIFSVINFFVFLCIATTAAHSALPQIDRTEAQPLLLLTQRLAEALESMGSPLSAEQTKALDALNAETDEAKITATLQRVLDPLCLAAVEIGADGEMKVTPGTVAEVEENGWRTVLEIGRAHV